MGRCCTVEDDGVAEEVEGVVVNTDDAFEVGDDENEKAAMEMGES